MDFHISTNQTIGIVITAALVVVLYVLGRSNIEPKQRAYANYGCVGVLVGGIGYWAGVIAPTIDTGVAVIKAALALGAMSLVYFEIRRAQENRPIAPRWKKFVGITLGVAGIVVYFNGFKVGYQKFWHRHDQYHYYFGAKYFKELGYDGLYKCTVVAMDELGTVDAEFNGKKFPLNLSAEVNPAKAVGEKAVEAAKNKKIRNLGGDNLLYPASDALLHKEECSPSAHDENGNVVSKFSMARWEQFKRDIKFFRLSTLDGKDYWDGMQKDHGYNPPPVWTLMGYFISSLHDASEGFMQFLGLIDEFFILGMFGGIYWAFGWRVFAVSAVLFGCQASAPNLWTLGAFLRQDWLFWFVMSACFARKRYYKLSGAAMVYSALLRVFPGLVIFGWLIIAGRYLWVHKRMHRHHLQTLIGGTAAAVVLVGASILVVGKDSYQSFYKHTIEVHDQTPLTNHMGLRVMIGTRTECAIPDGLVVAQGETVRNTLKGATLPGCEPYAYQESAKQWVARPEVGRMQYTQDDSMPDPFETWKNARNDRYKKYKFVAYGVIGLTLIFFAYVVRRVKTMWIAYALGQVFIILLSQLTNYYYSFIVISGPLTRARRDLEVKMFGFAALTQVVYWLFFFNDDKYSVLTYLTLGFCYFLIGSFGPKSWNIFDRPGTPKAAPSAKAGPHDGGDA